MKAAMIIFNQVNTERVEYMFDKLGIRGYTWWNDVLGRGSEDGEPRMGTHTLARNQLGSVDYYPR